MDLLLYGLLKGLSLLVNFLPLKFRRSLLYILIRGFMALSPGYYRISMKNLSLAFPKKSKEWKEGVYYESLKSLSRVIVDFLRLPYLDSGWIRDHVSCPFLSRYKQLKDKTNSGVIIATGHLGSFEIIAFSAPVLATPVAFVARDLKQPRLNRWIREARERTGNHFISRKRAMPRILEHLNNGIDVGILFDQNVREKHAVFVPWFGRPAATTRALALAALRTRAAVVVASIKFREDDHYEIEMEDCDFDDIYGNSEMSNDQKVEAITVETSRIYQRMIRSNPGEWFWFHRRWKTAPPGVKEDFYKD